MKTLFYFLLIISVSCKTNNKSPQDKTIERFLQDYYQTMSDRNWPTYETYFWKNATMCTIWNSDPNEEMKVDIFTIQDFLSKTAEGPDSQPIFEETMEESKITVNGSLATAWVKYQAKFGTEDELMRWSGTDLFSLMKFNDEWKIVNLSYSPE